MVVCYVLAFVGTVGLDYGKFVASQSRLLCYLCLVNVEERFMLVSFSLWPRRFRSWRNSIQYWSPHAHFIYYLFRSTWQACDCGGGWAFRKLSVKRLLNCSHSNYSWGHSIAFSFETSFRDSFSHVRFEWRWGCGLWGIWKGRHTGETPDEHRQSSSRPCRYWKHFQGTPAAETSLTDTMIQNVCPFRESTQRWQHSSSGKGSMKS